MTVYKDLRKRRVQVTLHRLDMTKAAEILRTIAENRRRQLEERRRASKLRFLKQQARHFEPYVPKLTSAYHLKKQSASSVLQSFTSAVQQLCSPEKQPQPPTSSSSPSASSSPSTTSSKRGPQTQCIDLCSSSDDEVELRSHIR